MLYKVFRSSPGLQLQDANSTPTHSQVVTIRMSPDFFLTSIPNDFYFLNFSFIEVREVRGNMRCILQIFGAQYSIDDYRDNVEEQISKT